MLTEVRAKPKPVKVVREKKRRIRRTSARELLNQKIHAVVRQIVLDRDNHCSCLTAPKNGHTKVRQAGHVITAKKESTRFDLRNVHEQCSGCNNRHVNYPHYYTDWYIRNFGEDAWHRLCEDSDKVKKMQLYELQELLDQLKKIRQKQITSNLMGEPYKPYFSQKDILSGAWNK